MAAVTFQAKAVFFNEVLKYYALVMTKVKGIFLDYPVKVDIK